MRAVVRKQHSELSFFTTGDGCQIAYRLDGAVGQPVLVLSNSIGTDLHMWDAQIEPLSKHFRVLRYDARGHGASDAPAEPYSMDRMGRDVVELLDALGIGRVHFCGLSLGGFVGQWLGIHAPERIGRLILCNTSSFLGPPAQFDARIALVLEVGDLSEIAATFLRNWFPSHMLEAGGPVVEEFRSVLLATHPRGFAGSYAGLRDTDLRRTVALIQAPTLVIAGRYDTVTGARLLVLPAVHLSNVEYPEEFMAAVLEFLGVP
jgi:3-oxoadipate enol-lactonase